MLQILVAYISQTGQPSSSRRLASIVARLSHGRRCPVWDMHHPVIVTHKLSVPGDHAVCMGTKLSVPGDHAVCAWGPCCLCCLCLGTMLSAWGPSCLCLGTKLSVHGDHAACIQAT